MKVIHALVGLILFLIVAAAGAALVYLPWFEHDLWVKGMELLVAQFWMASIAGAVLVILVVLYLISGVRRSPPGEQYLSFTNDGGTVSVSMRAIRDFLARLGDEFAAVTSLQPALQSRGGSLYVELDLRVRSGTQIPELCKLLQDRVRESIQENFGVSNVKSVKVNVREIVPSPAGGAKDEPEASAA